MTAYERYHSHGIGGVVMVVLCFPRSNLQNTLLFLIDVVSDQNSQVVKKLQWPCCQSHDVIKGSQASLDS